jgi:hypothetical protein
MPQPQHFSQEIAGVFYWQVGRANFPNNCGTFPTFMDLSHFLRVIHFLVVGQ